LNIYAVIKVPNKRWRLSFTWMMD